MFLQRSTLNRAILLIIFTFFILLAGCAKPHILLEQVVVKNATDSKITEVVVRHQPTNKIGRVNAILPQKTLDIGFPSQPMLANKAVISWRDGAGQPWEVALDIPYDQKGAQAGQTMQLIYVIRTFGVVDAHLQASIQ